MGTTFRRLAELATETICENRLLPKYFLRRLKGRRSAFMRSVVKVGGVGAEIGVQKGFFTHAILQNAEPSRLHLIDPWYLLGGEWPWASASKSTTKALQNIIYWFRKELADKTVVLHIGLDDDVLPTFQDEYFDWVYLDTSHFYDDTKRELELLDRKVKPHGVILGDDWFSAPNHHFYGQYRAINEFVESKGYRFVAVDEPGHQWAICKAETTENSNQPSEP